MYPMTSTFHLVIKFSMVQINESDTVFFVSPSMGRKNTMKKRKKVKKKQLAVPQTLIRVLWMMKNMSLVMQSLFKVKSEVCN